MGTKNGRALAELMALDYLEEGGPFAEKGAVGAKDGFPIAVDWTKRGKQACVALSVRYKRGSLRHTPEEARAALLADASLLQAMGKKKLSSAEQKAACVQGDRLNLFWDYSFGAPKPQAVSAAVEALVRFAALHAQPVGEGCDLCGAATGGMLYCLEGTPQSVCGACSGRIEAENQEKARAWEGVEPRPLLGYAAGAVAATLLALAWGGIAFMTNRIYVALALGIGFCVATALRLAMRKVTFGGKIATFLLTVFSVLAGDFFFILLSVAKEMHVSPSGELVQRVLSHFAAIEFSNSSGYLSLLFGIVGAVAALTFLKQKPPGRGMVRVQPGRRA